MGESASFIGLSLTLCAAVFVVVGLIEAKDEEMIELKKSQGDDSYKSTYIDCFTLKYLTLPFGSDTGNSGYEM